MEIKTYSDLAKLADTCRKKGIEYLKVTESGVEFRLGDKPKRKKSGKEAVAGDTQTDPPYSEEEVLLWSAGVEA